MTKVFLIGDSISLHYRPYLLNMVKDSISFEPNIKELKNFPVKSSPRYLYSYIICGNKIAPSVLNCGDSNSTLKRIKSYIKYDMFHANLVLFNCGLHDIKRNRKHNDCQVDIEKYKQNLLEIINIVGSKRLCWITSTPVLNGLHAKKKFDRFEEDIEEYNSAAKKIMKNAKIPIIDLYKFTLMLTGKKYCDHVHFTEEVRKKQATFIAESLNDYFLQEREVR